MMIWPAPGFCRVQFLLPGEHPNLPVSCIFRAGLAAHPRSSLGLNRQSRHRGEARSMAQERQEQCRNKRSICSSGERSGEKQSFWIVNRRLSHWRPGPESNRRTRICRLKPSCPSMSTVVQKTHHFRRILAIYRYSLSAPVHWSSPTIGCRVGNDVGKEMVFLSTPEFEWDGATPQKTC